MLINFTFSIPIHSQQDVSHRNPSSISIEDFKTNILTSQILQSKGVLADDCVNAFNKFIGDLTDSQVPFINKIITLRPNAPWYSYELRCAKRERRRLERHWMSKKLEIHHQMYRKHCQKYNNLLLRLRKEYFLDKISACSTN